MTGVVAHQHFLKGSTSKGLDGSGDLNTRVRETPQQRDRRLFFSGLLNTFLTFGTTVEVEETVFPPDEGTEEIFIDELYSPMLDAKCFNDKYDIPSLNKHELYRDYKRIFDWGLENPIESPLFAESTGVTSNRFPSMCLRMAFHDNTINGQDGAEYVASKINHAGEWTGPHLMMETSGGDASVLTCKPERFHPNNNYDQTASRILHAFQSKEDYPKGPGIGGSGDSLMSKYKMSYADALHNCAIAAIKYMTESADSTVSLEFGISNSELDSISNLPYQFSFGRKDACYVTSKMEVLYTGDGLGANSRRPLCGPSDILPGVTLQAKGVLDWFDSRELPVGVWLSLFGTHTALDNFSSEKNIRYFGLPDNDYFEDYVGCPFHQLHPPVVDPEDTGCDWTPACKDPYNTNQAPWFLVQSDCATSIDLIQAANDPALDTLENQMQVYINTPGSWLLDIVCALSHLGGNDSDCVGPYGITSPQKSMFGSFWKNDYPAQLTLEPLPEIAGPFVATAVATFDNISGGNWQRVFDFGNGPEKDNVWLGQEHNTANMVLEVWKNGHSTKCVANSIIYQGEKAIWKAGVDANGVGTIKKGWLNVAGYGWKTVAECHDMNVPANVIRNNKYVGKSNWWWDTNLIGNVYSLKFD